LRWPTRVFAWLAGSGADSLVASELQELRSKEMVVLLHPSDLVIHADEPIAARVFAQVNEHLAFSKAYLSWTKEGQEIEEGVRKIAGSLSEGKSLVPTSQQREKLTGLRKKLEGMNLEAEEWEVLFREILLVEKMLGDRMVADAKKGPAALEPLIQRISPSQFDTAAANGHGEEGTSPLKMASIAGAALAFGTVVWRNWRARHPAE